MPVAQAWGPFLPDLDPAERRARLRALRVAVHVHCRSRGAEVETHLRRAEVDETALEAAATAFDTLASLDRRHVLATFGATL